MDSKGIIMLYLSQMLGKPVVDCTGEKIGTVSDLAISTGEVFPRITSLAFQGPGKIPFMISWRKYVDEFDDDGLTLQVEAHDIRFSYLQPDEVLLARDLMNRQIVDTQGLKVVRVNDLKLSVSGSQLRLLGAEVGVRGILRGLAPWIERSVVSVAKVFGKKIDEQIIAWNYMDLLDRDLSEVQLSVTHKRLDELHRRRRGHFGATGPAAARKRVRAPRRRPGNRGHLGDGGRIPVRLHRKLGQQAGR